MGFESQTEKKATDSDFIEEVYENLKSKGGRRIDPNLFDGIIPSEKIKANLRWAEGVRVDILRSEENNPAAREASKLSEISEGVLSLHEEWLGDGAKVIRTSEYDDIANGVDLITELKGVSFALDVTFEKEIERKIHKIRDEIRAGTLGKIEYYESPSDGVLHGQKEKVPKFVVALGADTIKRIAEYLTEKAGVAGKDQVQFTILKEIKIQCAYFMIYAKSMDQKEVVDIFKKVLDQIKSKYKEKTEGSGKIKDMSQVDKGFIVLTAELRKSFPEVKIEDAMALFG